MTDSHLRELERRFRASGSAEDEAAWLLERVRNGDVSQEDAELASYLGHEAACRVFGSSGPPTSGAALARARLALAWLEVRAWESDYCQPSPDDREALSLIDAWVAASVTPHLMRKINLVSRRSLKCRRLHLFLLDILRREGAPSGESASLPEGPEWDGGLLADSWREKSEAAIRDELVPWILGYTDPVRERVEAREAASGE